MSHVWHLVTHDLQAHRGILLAWLATVIALPLVACLPWSDQRTTGFGVAAAIGLQAARVLLGMAAIASIVQADSPIDDRSFWRTRPITARTLARAHLATVVGLFVGIPMLVVLATGIVVGLPMAQWPSVLAQVAITELACAGLSLLVATRTRGLAPFLIWIVLAVLIAFTLPLGVHEVGRLLFGRELLRTTDTWLVLRVWTLVGALALPALFLVAMAGPRRQRWLLAGVLAVAALSTGVWFIPGLRRTPPIPTDAGLSPTPRTIRAIDVPGPPGGVALVLDVGPVSTELRDTWLVSRFQGRLTIDGIVRPVDEFAETRRFTRGQGRLGDPGITPPGVARILTVFDVDTHRRLTGTRVRLDAGVTATVVRRITEGSARLTPGATILTSHSRLTLQEVTELGLTAEGRPALTVRGLEVGLEPGALLMHQHVYMLRDRSTGCEVGLAQSSPEGTRSITNAARLPTLVRPFSADRVVMRVSHAPRCEFDAARADIAMRTYEYLQVPQGWFSLDFTVPPTGGTYTPTPSAGPPRAHLPAAARREDGGWSGGPA
ncbi:hypothetical protein TBR22_A35920 [Luteitalea sp. TBR-22]|uniref:hypothetical protein n=1 Tax=Luteitalea sp. TBR-22 TaxID=2802971 RepID=UPI001AF6C1EC|nr:hypothetical protein [Luteitalea sp. TBR-22]BCS34362.1 hypothetical protein TBR22_A35920 [Luteitalea sp. TBR-22]